VRLLESSIKNGSSPDVTAFILAGGKSTRMGEDKAFVTLNGRTLLARALELAHTVSPDVRIVGDPAKFSPFAPVVEDVFRNCGPLGGIHAALRASPTDLNLILAVDVPFVSPALLQYLIMCANTSAAAIATVPRTNGGWQPLCAIYRRQFADAAEQALRAGRYKIDALFAAAQTQAIEGDKIEAAGFSPKMFRNLNTQEELEAARNEEVSSSE
jgi:molybdopterin-guanine dinucleotide biosynthesis protein A